MMFPDRALLHLSIESGTAQMRLRTGLLCTTLTTLNRRPTWITSISEEPD